MELTDKVLRSVAGPLRDFLLAQFGLLREQQEALAEELAAARASVQRELEDVRATLQAVLDHQAAGDRAADARAEVTTTALGRVEELLRGGGALPRSTADMTERERRMCDRVLAHDGWAADAGLWFNPPASVQHREAGVTLEDVNERIAEVPFVLRGLAALPSPARILDVGSRESLLPLSLACLGYSVTALDPRGYPLVHPDLRVAECSLADHEVTVPYDAVTCVSTIEHLGLGSYALDTEPDADLAAAQHVRRLLRPGGLLLLTTPFGPAAVDELERTYDEARLGRLLEGFQILERRWLRRLDRRTWVALDDAAELAGERGVVLVAARSA